MSEKVKLTVYIDVGARNNLDEIYANFLMLHMKKPLGWIIGEAINSMHYNMKAKGEIEKES